MYYKVCIVGEGCFGLGVSGGYDVFGCIEVQ